MVSSAGLAFQVDLAMRPPTNLMVFFLEAKEDSWTILKALFQRDPENSRLRLIEAAEPEAPPRPPVAAYT